MVNKLRFLGIIALAVIIGFTLSSCDFFEGLLGGDDGKDQGTLNIAVTGVSVKSETSILIGSTETLFATITPPEATNQNITWNSTDTAIATVSPDGLVTAHALGTASIIVTTVDGGHIAICNITVSSVPIDVTSILLEPTNVSIPMGYTETITATIMPANATNQNLTWTSSNTEVAIVSASGIVTGISLGSAIIIVSANDGSGVTTSANITINPIPITNVQLIIREPITGGSPSTMALGEDNFTLPDDAVSWFPPHNQFIGNTEYTVTIMLRAEPGFTFTGLNSATINGYNASVVPPNIGTAVMLSYTFPATPALDIGINRYQAVPYDGNKLKFSYRYMDYDVYYFYLGRLRNIPLFNGTHQGHNPSFQSEYVFSTSSVTTETISREVSNSSETAITTVEENTFSSSTGGSVWMELEVKGNFGYVETGLKVGIEANWNESMGTMTGTSIMEGRSLTDTIGHAKETAEGTMEERRFPLTQEMPEGVYRYTMFMDSDVYLFVIKNSITDEIHVEFREHVIPIEPQWNLDFCADGHFGKDNNSDFEFDISLLDDLPTPDLNLGFLVTNIAQWNNALTTIRSQGSGIAGTPLTYTILINGNVSVPGSTVTSTNFGSAQHIQVILKGNGTLSLQNNGSIFRIGNNQQLVIDDGTLALLGRNNNNNAVIYVQSGGTLELQNGTIRGNTTSSMGSGVHIENNGNFIKKGGIIYGNDAGINSNTSTSSTSHAVHWNRPNTVSLYLYRFFTLNESNDISTESPNTPNSWDTPLQVSSSAQWTSAMTEINNRPNNRNSTIVVNGDVAVSGRQHNDNNFTGSNIIVTLQGTGRIYLTSRGNIFRVGNNQTLIINGVTLEGLRNGQNNQTEDNNEPVIHVQGGGSLELRSGTIRGNTNSNNGGGVSITDGRFTVTGGYIVNNRGEWGGGIHNYGGHFTMTGGTITANTSNMSGGGVRTSHDNGRFNMENGTISFNRANRGSCGGVSVDRCHFVMTNGTINNNTAGDNGGAVESYDYTASFIMSGGTIRGNEAESNGGGVLVYHGRFIKQPGAIIYGNNEGANSNIARKDGRGHAVLHWWGTNNRNEYNNTLRLNDTLTINPDRG